MPVRGRGQADSYSSLRLIRFNRDVTSPSFRFGSRPDVSLTGRPRKGRRVRASLLLTLQTRIADTHRSASINPLPTPADRN